MKLCNAPFCPNPPYIHKNKSYGYCSQHLHERLKFKVKAYVELLPLWAFKRCKVHGLLNFDQSYLHKSKGNPVRFRCKKCTLSYINSIYDPEKAKISNAKKSSQKRSRELKCVYGITLDDYHTMLASQGNSCAICETPSVHKKRKSFDVDHCHTTNKVRGLLCHSCNVGIGFLKDNVKLLERAILYLTKHSSYSATL